MPPTSDIFENGLTEPRGVNGGLVWRPGDGCIDFSSDAGAKRVKKVRMLSQFVEHHPMGPLSSSWLYHSLKAHEHRHILTRRHYLQSAFLL